MEFLQIEHSILIIIIIINSFELMNLEKCWYKYKTIV